MNANVNIIVNTLLLTIMGFALFSNGVKTALQITIIWVLGSVIIIITYGYIRRVIDIIMKIKTTLKEIDELYEKIEKRKGINK